MLSQKSLITDDSFKFSGDSKTKVDARHSINHQRDIELEITEDETWNLENGDKEEQKESRFDN
jgi:hypothetical protein